MSVAAFPANEKQRLDVLRGYDILDTEPEEALDAMVQLAAYICQTPIAAISLVDECRQWFKAIVGLDAKETSRDVAFCSHTILQDNALIVEDARVDERFRDNPLVTSAPDIRFYAGIPLTTTGGYRLGTLCVLDRVTRELSPAQVCAIETLADNIMAHLDLRQSHKQARRHIHELQLAASIFNAASEAMVVTDAQNCIIKVNPAFTAITGYTPSEVIGKNPSILSSGRQSEDFYLKMWKCLADEGRWQGELWNKRKSGEHYVQQLSIKIVSGEEGEKQFHIAIFSDITSKKQAEEMVWKQANYDHLTQLPNRRMFLDRLEQEVAMSHRTRQPVTLLYIDLDRFKVVNDTMGHYVGDELLKQVADRIRQSVRKTDTVSRLGGDEFTVIVPHTDDPILIEKISKNIIKKLEQTFLVHGAELTVSASIGIASCPKHGASPEQILKASDFAMYEAKKIGRGCFCYSI